MRQHEDICQYGWVSEILSKGDHLVDEIPERPVRVTIFLHCCQGLVTVSFGI